MIHTQENGTKPDFGPDFRLMGPNAGRENLFFKNLASSVTRYRHVQYQKKLMLLRKISDRSIDVQTVIS